MANPLCIAEYAGLAVTAAGAPAQCAQYVNFPDAVNGAPIKHATDCRPIPGRGDPVASYTTGLTFAYTQPLLRGLFIDQQRQQLAVTQINREISEETLRASAEMVRGIRAQGLEITAAMGEPAVEEWEIASMHRAHHTGSR